MWCLIASAPDSEAEVLGSYLATPTLFLLRPRIIENNVEKSQGREGNLSLRQKIFFLNLLFPTIPNQFGWPGAP